MKSKIFFYGITLSILSSLLVKGQGASYGTDSVGCITNLSLYTEYYKQKNYEDAYNPWRWVFINCPAARKGTYIYGVDIVKARIKKQTDAALKEKYIDTLMLLYDQRIKYFGEEGSVLGKKGVDLFELRPKQKEEANAMLKESIALDKNDADPIVVFRYFQVNSLLVKSNKETKEQLIDLYDQLSDIIDYNIEKGNYVSSFEAAKTNIEALFSPFASCEDLTSIYSAKFKANPDDIVLLKKITGILDKKKCTDTDLFFEAASALYKKEPSANAAINLAKMNVGKKQYSKASSYYKEAIDQESDNDKKAVYYAELADITYRYLKASPDAKTYALKAVGLRPNWGLPYILLGDIYAAGASSCGDAFQAKTVYWVAVDKYVKARSVDASVAEDARRKIATFSKYFPEKNDLFFRNIKEGDSYSVECWINETTTARAR